MNVISFVTGKETAKDGGRKSVSAIVDAHGHTNYYDGDPPSLC